jgi:hypothetical protein
MVILLVVLLTILALLSLNTIETENKKDKESIDQLKKNVSDYGWKCLEGNVFVKGTFTNTETTWQVKKEEGEIVWFVDNLHADNHLWVLDKKRTFLVNYSSSILQFLLTLSYGKDEAKELAQLQKAKIENSEFNDLFIVLTTNNSLANQLLTTEVIRLLTNWRKATNSKRVPRIILSKRCLEIKLHQTFLDFSTLNKLVELGQSIIKNPAIFVKSH